MRKLHLVGLALVAVFAFCALAVSSASAEVALWLWNAGDITENLAVTTTGLLTLATLVLGVDFALIHCEGAFDGTVGPNGVDEITAVLNATGEEIGQNLVGRALSCVGEGGECPLNSLAELWVDNLPWLTQLELMEPKPGEVLILNLLFKDGTDSNTGLPGYHVLCTNSGGTIIENLCTGNTSADVSNGTGNVIGIFSFTESEKSTCTTGEGDIEGEGLITHNGGGTLAVSDP